MKPFDIELALRGDNVYHVSRQVDVTNVTKVGNRIAFTIPDDGDTVYNCLTDGTCPDDGDVILAMKPKTHTVYINLWDCTDFFYSKYSTKEDALSATGFWGRNYPKLNVEPIEIITEVK